MIKVEFLDGTANKLMNNAKDKWHKLTSSEYRMLSEINKALNDEVSGSYELKTRTAEIPIKFEITKDNTIVDKGLEKLNKNKSRYIIKIDKDNDDNNIIIVNCADRDYPFEFHNNSISKIVSSVQKDLKILGLEKIVE